MHAAYLCWIICYYHKKFILKSNQYFSKPIILKDYRYCIRDKVLVYNWKDMRIHWHQSFK